MNPKAQELLATKMVKVVPVKYVRQIIDCSSCLCQSTGFCQFYSRLIERSPGFVAPEYEKPAWCSLTHVELFGTIEIKEGVSDD